MVIYDFIVYAQQGRGREGLLYVLGYILALLTALVLHEIAHGLVALWNGDITAKSYGRLSLNPMRHFDLIGLLMMLFVGFGWAKPVPVDPRNFKKRKTGCITVSIAGVLTNLVLAFFFAMLLVAFALIKSPSIPQEGVDYLVYFCRIFSQWALTLNINFALFNILPLFPLDGYRLLSCFVSENNGFMKFMRRYSLYIMLGFIALNYIPFVSSYSPLNLYIGKFGGLIEDGFIAFWRLIFNV
ncbi:MAG: site-2 protease family protein [Corallococcus sp.]|nr:site-2 protease family protein [Corallococcus sp.]